MKKTSPIALLGVLAMALTMTACGGDGDGTSTSGASSTEATTEAPPTDTATAEETSDVPEETEPAEEPIVLSMSGWSLETTPEFQVLADAFHAANPNVTVELREYDPNDYETLMLADMSSGSATDIITIKQAKFTTQWAEGGQLMDISDIVSGLPANVSGAGSYTVSGVNYGVPYRQDSWVLFYNKDLFDQAGVATPDGTWTWDKYAEVAKELASKLDGVKGTYEHSWQSTLQGFAQAQTPGADLAGGQDYSYLKPYYERVLDLQDSGAQETYANITTNSLTYQANFGKQSAAMMAMGSWYVATLISQQASGDADTFNWGIAPVPQYDESTTGTDKVPVTFGDPTGLAINANIDPAKLDAAKAFLQFAASEEAGVALAGIGILSSVASDAVTEAYFAQSGIPTDDLSKFAIGTHETKPENPQSPYIAAIQSALGEAHTAIMSESSSIDDAIAMATETIQAELG
ncbi:MAG: extracellular solute-binding protein [Bifidobacteriaceae bacterium]|jgi:multiple sugar transport system substrate-binding protein|nr:extracellular solute-binding protein [Bifidobacteriaceae bacterium]